MNDTVRVMTFNIWQDGTRGKQPLSQTVKVIRAANADVVGIQEVRKNTKAIADSLGWNYVQQKRGTAILSRYEIDSVTENKLGAKINLQSGRSFYIFNVHLMHAPYQPYQLLNIPYHNAPFLKTEKEAIDAAKQARGKQVDSLLKEIGAGINLKTPVFITGDFNEPSHLDWTKAAVAKGIHPLKVLYPSTSALSSKGFKDAYRSLFPNEVKHPGFTWTTTTSPDDPNDHHDRIDFIFFKGDKLRVIKAQTIGARKEHSDIVVSPYPSDHRAVVAEFVLEK